MYISLITLKFTEVQENNEGASTKSSLLPVFKLPEFAQRIFID